MSPVQQTPLRKAFDASAFKSQSAFARRLRRSEGQVSRWLNGLVPADEQQRNQIARALETDVKDLWPHE